MLPSTVTLQFCAFNEGAVLQEKLDNIEVLKERHPGLEVLAYDDGSTDHTRDMLASRPDLLQVIDGAGRTGKAHGMKRLAAMATGDILVFTDANVLLQDDAIDRLLAWYEDPEVGGVCGTLRYINPGESATASVGGAYWRLEEKLKALESRTGNVMGADGSIFSLRRELYPSFPDTVLDDLTVSMASVFAGRRLLKVDDVVAFERLVSGRQDEFARKVRIAARAFHTHLYLRPQLRAMGRLDKFKYRSRKLVRWFGGLFLIVGALSAFLLAATFSPWAGLGFAVVLAAAAFAGSRIHNGPAGLVTETVLALLATLIGVLKAARGQTFVTWSPAKSR
ncbi:glycosyltransferase [Nocardioides sp. Kera G14]|uniref:glycosyltransferase n=1 Tax=Nocardioides sp. Kera G14 TaxID=2884264 RepID=UPI001D104376|nr:glycosyltransferase [Nocardioides sp. Kera G14]UDY23106.1 glycosyltransferase [Nocardioides sp. Kera G14]